MGLLKYEFLNKINGKFELTGWTGGDFSEHESSRGLSLGP